MSKRFLHLPYWIVFFSTLIAFLILLLGGIMIGLGQAEQESQNRSPESTLSARLKIDELFCQKDSDCTKYNTSSCCGWQPVNIYFKPLKKHASQVCDQDCLYTMPKCENGRCLLKNRLSDSKQENCSNCYTPDENQLNYQGVQYLKTDDTLTDSGTIFSGKVAQKKDLGRVTIFFLDGELYTVENFDLDQSSFNYRKWVSEKSS